MKWIVEIIDRETGEVVKSLRCDYGRQAEKVERGMNINMNHDLYFTRVVEVAQ